MFQRKVDCLSFVRCSYQTCHSKYGPWVSNIDIFWDHVRSMDSWATQTYWSRTSMFISSQVIGVQAEVREALQWNLCGYLAVTLCRSWADRRVPVNWADSPEHLYDGHIKMLSSGGYFLRETLTLNNICRGEWLKYLSWYKWNVSCLCDVSR